MDLLKSTAENMNMYDASTGGVSQGFGVITSVIMAQAGMNVVALSDGSNWSVSGQASYLQNMLTQAGGEALYSKAEYEGNVLSFLWPGQGNQFSSILVPGAWCLLPIPLLPRMEIRLCCIGSGQLDHSG